MPRKHVIGTALSPQMRNHFLKEWRVYRGLSGLSLAKKSGLENYVISKLERGGQQYSQYHLEALARALGCSPADLISVNPLTGPQKPTNGHPPCLNEVAQEIIVALAMVWRKMPESEARNFLRMVEASLEFGPFRTLEANSATSARILTEFAVRQASISNNQ